MGQPVLWQVALVLVAAAVTELAACRLWAFYRAEGLWVSVVSGTPMAVDRSSEPVRIGQALPLLLLLLSINLYRCIYFAVDPFFSRGIFSMALDILLTSCDDAMAASGTVLFLIRVGAATKAQRTSASCFVVGPFWVRVALVVMAWAVVVFDGVTSMLFLFSYSQMTYDVKVCSASAVRRWRELGSSRLGPRWSPWCARVQFFIISVGFPSLLISLALAAGRTALEDGTHPTARRLGSRCLAYAACRAVGLGAIVAYKFWGRFVPHRMLILGALYGCGLCGASYALTDALLPEDPGAKVPRGPFRLLTEWTATMMSLTKREPGSITPEQPQQEKQGHTDAGPAI